MSIDSPDREKRHDSRTYRIEEEEEIDLSMLAYRLQEAGTDLKQTNMRLSRKAMNSERFSAEDVHALASEIEVLEALLEEIKTVADLPEPAADKLRGRHLDELAWEIATNKRIEGAVETVHGLTLEYVDESSMTWRVTDEKGDFLDTFSAEESDDQDVLEHLSGLAEVADE